MIDNYYYIEINNIYTSNKTIIKTITIFLLYYIKYKVFLIITIINEQN